LAAGTLFSAQACLTTGRKAQQNTWKIGCYTRPWAKFEYTVALDEIAKAGFRYMGLMTSKDGLIVSAKTSFDDARRFDENVKKRQLKVLSIYGGSIAVQKSLKDGIVDLRKLIDLSVIVSSETLMMGGVSDPDLNERYYEAIKQCCDYAEDKNVELILKPHGGLNATGPQCRQSIEKVGHRNFNLWYDPGNIFFYSDGALDPVDDAETVNGLVTGMCIKDYVHPKRVDVDPGKGKVDFPGVMAKLIAGGFTGGSLVIETLAPGDIASLHNQAVATRQYVENLVA